MSHRCAANSQGGVQVPTGGNPSMVARERLPLCRDSRSGEIPEPTVIVRMKEDKTVFPALCGSFTRPDSCKGGKS